MNDSCSSVYEPRWFKIGSSKTNHWQCKYELPRAKTNNVAVRPAKTQISLGIRPTWSESLLCAQWVAKGPSFLHADSEDSDQTGQMPWLIWVFAGHTLTLLVLSRGGSYKNFHKKKSSKLTGCALSSPFWSSWSTWIQTKNNIEMAKSIFASKSVYHAINSHGLQGWQCSMF